MIPTYNEKENITKLLRELSAQSFEILIVDDLSPDGTADVVKAFQKKHSNIHLLSHRKEGLGKAMIRGYKYALQKFNPDVIVTNEADFGFSFRHLPKMLAKIKDGYDVVVTSRHVGNGRSEGWTVSRRLNHFLANTFFAGWVAGVDAVKDRNGAMRAVRVKGVLDKLDFNRFPTRGFAFFFFQIYKLSKITDKFYEIPSVFRFRSRGESKVSFNPKYFRTYLADILEYIRLAFAIRLGYY